VCCEPLETTENSVKFSKQLAALGFGTYSEYLASPHWKHFRARYKKAGLPLACAVCGASSICLHHHTYVRLGQETLEDVTPLCRSCHTDVHITLKAGPKFVEFTFWAIEVLQARRLGRVGPPCPERVQQPQPIEHPVPQPKPVRGRKKKARLRKSQQEKHLPVRERARRLQAEKARQVREKEKAAQMLAYEAQQNPAASLARSISSGAFTANLCGNRVRQVDRAAQIKEVKRAAEKARKERNATLRAEAKARRAREEALARPKSPPALPTQRGLDRLYANSRDRRKQQL
jgi:hypothetical protein